MGFSKGFSSAYDSAVRGTFDKDGLPSACRLREDCNLAWSKKDYAKIKSAVHYSL